MSVGAEARQIIAKVGLWWPAADEDRLRQAASDWDRLAEAIDHVAATGAAGARDVIGGNQGAAIEAFAAFWARYDGSEDAYLPATATAARQIAGALSAYADEVARAKARIEELAVTIGASLIVGTALAIFTFGISEAAADSVSAGLIAAAEAVGADLADSAASIVASTLVGGAMGAVEGFAVDVAVAQPIRIEVFHDGGFSWSEAGTSALIGGVTGGVLSGGSTAARQGWSAIREALAPDTFPADPAFDYGPLGDQFEAGVHDPTGAFEPKETDTSQWLAQEEGWRIDARPADHTVPNQKNPDVMVRKSPDDPGTIMDLKKLESGTSTAVKRNIHDAADQVPPDGEVVIDGRDVNLSEENATRGFRRALGQIGRGVPPRVHVILGDGRLLTLTRNP